jgi:hypothetical protein
MDPNKKILNGDREPVTETDEDHEIENENIADAIVTSEPHIPDVTGLNTDTSFVNSVNDAEEPES